jgi:hypothetical protein
VDTFAPGLAPRAALRIQRAAERHLELCWSALYAIEDAPAGTTVYSPAVADFCGCDVCVTREVLAGAWPEIEAHFALGGGSPKLTSGASGPERG